MKRFENETHTAEVCKSECNFFSVYSILIYHKTTKTYTMTGAYNKQSTAEYALGLMVEHNTL